MKNGVLRGILAVPAGILIGGAAVLRAATPPGDAAAGRPIYEAKCLACHGTQGKGDGPAAAFLVPRPRDFTAGKFKFRSTETGSILAEGDLLSAIRNGLHGTAMPDWDPFLHGDSLASVLAYVKSFSPRFKSETPREVKLGAQVPSSPASVEAGGKIYRRLECASCHGTDGKGKDAVAADLQDDWGNSIKATNLAEPWTFRGGATARDVYLRFRTGIDGSPMPSYAGSASDREMWDLANYVVSLGRKPLWSMNAEEIKSFYAMQDAAAQQHPVERGRYLANTIGCAFCHSPVREDGSMIEEFRMAGGQRWDLYPFTNVVSYNLTSDKETGLGGWTDDQIKTFLTKGIRRDGSRMLPYPMPWPAFASLKEADLNAIVAYLRSLPPVYNKIPDPVSPNIFTYLWGKFKVLILKEDIPLHVYPGNAGTGAGTTLSANETSSKEDKR